MELDATSREYEEFNARDTPIIADMDKELRAAYAYLDGTRDESERELIISKDREIVDLRENCKNLAQPTTTYEGKCAIKNYSSKTSLKKCT